MWAQIAKDEDARAVVLPAAGRAFSAGGDLDSFLQDQVDLEHRRCSIRNARRLATEVIGFHLPVVTAVNGLAVGLGCNLAILGDVVLMAESAYLADTHVAAWLVAGDGGAAFWPVYTVILKARELVFFGDKLSRAEAVSIGLATRVVPDADLRGEAIKVAERFAALPQRAMQDTKCAFNIHLAKTLDVMDSALEAGPDHGAVAAAGVRADVRNPGRRPQGAA